ncbi:MAG: flagellar protein FlbB [Treponema sp.]|jgi:flagellar protein FlbB|nr:flagellar protein FlbB [Treponema sp.]
MIGKSLLLLLLVLVLAIGGLIWFDYLNVIDAKNVLAPVYRFIPFISSGEPRTQPWVPADEILNLDNERLAIRLEALELQRMEVEAFRRELDSRHGQIEQMAEEVEDRQKALEELANSLRLERLDTDNRDRNIEQIARYLTGMPPQNAVEILAAMDDQGAIDVLRKTEEIARAEGARSIVAFWFSLMDPARAAELQRKMAGRPASL